MGKGKWLLLAAATLTIAGTIGILSLGETMADANVPASAPYEMELSHLVEKTVAAGFAVGDSMIEERTVDDQTLLAYKLVIPVADRRAEVLTTCALIREAAIAKATGMLTADYLNIVTVGAMQNTLAENPHGVEIPSIDLVSWNGEGFSLAQETEDYCKFVIESATAKGLPSPSCELAQCSVGVSLTLKLALEDTAKAAGLRPLCEDVWSRMIEMHDTKGARVSLLTLLVDDPSGEPLYTAVFDAATGMYMIGSGVGYIED